MSKDDKSGGLLSKVVQFVKNPNTEWSAINPGAEEPGEPAYSKQALKEMIERKRRNDFVRKREFDMLRKIRRQGDAALQDMALRGSFFHSSLPSKPDDRAMTLRKIDEIEAQMSQQWWKAKQVPGQGASAPTPPVSPSGAELSMPDSYPMQAGGSPTLPPTDVPPLLATFDQTNQPAYQPTDRVPMPHSQAEHAPAYAKTEPAPIGLLGSPQPDEVGSEAASLSGSFNLYVHDPELEEAAIRYANGDTAGAELGLLEAIGPGGSRRDHDETWLTLFDLYRAAGLQDRFESAAIDYAQRFSRSAPAWYSMPEEVGQLGAQAPSAGPSYLADWKCPSVVGVQTVAALSAQLSKAPSPWRIDWSGLRQIEADARLPLHTLMGQWVASPVRLAFVAAEILEQVLREYTPSGDKTVPPVCWDLRLTALRVLNRADEFELAALDYCVTYEVSPPSWESARCIVEALDLQGQPLANHTIIGEISGESLHPDSEQPDTRSVASVSDEERRVELGGEILGDAAEALERLDAQLKLSATTLVSCSRLVRVDFSAAGSLLNWVAARQAEGRVVHFVELNRMVATFFNVLGINEHARISARRG